MRRLTCLPSFAVVTAFALALIAVPHASARAQATPPSASSVPAANPADVGSMDAIIKALYDVISGPAAQKRNWDRMRSLFISGARLIPAGGAAPRVLTVDDYINQAGPNLERNGFFEREISNKVESFGHITHTFSTYESRRTAEDATPFARGINSIQLFNDGTRWWIVTVYWDSERPNNQIPAKYLPK
jgi:hypothetical protein